MAVSGAGRPVTPPRVAPQRPATPAAPPRTAQQQSRPTTATGFSGSSSFTSAPTTSRSAATATTVGSPTTAPDLPPSEIKNEADWQKMVAYVNKDKYNHSGQGAMQQLNALRDPQLAARELQFGTVCPDGFQVSPPPAPGSDRYNLLVKIANGLPVTQEEIYAEGKKVGNKSFGDQMMWGNIWNGFKAMFEKANEQLKEAMQKNAG
jgi:hypothetical protein